jgi:hypothetical protein
MHARYLDNAGGLPVLVDFVLIQSTMSVLCRDAEWNWSSGSVKDEKHAAFGSGGSRKKICPFGPQYEAGEALKPSE